MKVTIVAVVMALFIGITLAEFHCEQKGRFLDRFSNCTEFIDCQVDKNNSLKLTRMTCPFEELFSVEEQRCVLASNLMCRVLTDGTTTSIPILTDTPTTPSPKLPTSIKVNTSLPNLDEIFRCPAVGKYPSYVPGCRKYFDCQLQFRNILPKLESCPETFVFSPVQSNCVSETAYKCPTIDLREDSIVTNPTDNKHPIPAPAFSCTERGRFPVKEPGCKRYTLCTIDQLGNLVQEVFECRSGIFSGINLSCVLNGDYVCPYDNATVIASPTENIEGSNQAQHSFIQIDAGPHINDSSVNKVPAGNNKPNSPPDGMLDKEPDNSTSRKNKTGIDNQTGSTNPINSEIISLSPTALNKTSSLNPDASSTINTNTPHETAANKTEESPSASLPQESNKPKLNTINNPLPIAVNQTDGPHLTALDPGPNNPKVSFNSTHPTSENRTIDNLPPTEAITSNYLVSPNSVTPTADNKAAALSPSASNSTTSLNTTHQISPSDSASSGVSNSKASSNTTHQISFSAPAFNKTENGVNSALTKPSNQSEELNNSLLYASGVNYPKQNITVHLEQVSANKPQGIQADEVPSISESISNTTHPISGNLTEVKHNSSLDPSGSIKVVSNSVYPHAANLTDEKLPTKLDPSSSHFEVNQNSSTPNQTDKTNETHTALLEPNHNSSGSPIPTSEGSHTSLPDPVPIKGETIPNNTISPSNNNTNGVSPALLDPVSNNSTDTHPSSVNKTDSIHATIEPGSSNPQIITNNSIPTIANKTDGVSAKPLDPSNSEIKFNITLPPTNKSDAAQINKTAEIAPATVDQTSNHSLINAPSPANSSNPTVNNNPTLSVVSTQIQTSTSNDLSKCPDEGVYAVQEPGCNRFYMCHATKTGRYVQKIFACDVDEVFSEIELACVKDPGFRCAYDVRDAAEDMKCHSEGAFAIPEVGCKRFITCQAQENGDLIKDIHSCKDNEVYAGTILYCVHDPDFVCPYNSTHLPANITSAVNKSTAVIPQLGPLQKGCAADNSERFTCPSTGRFVNPNSRDCGSYYLCLKAPSNEMWFAAVNCELGTIFNGHSATCENAAKTVCSSATKV